MRIRGTSGSETERSDLEKVKRVKLVDQFGKYMIGSLGRHGDEGLGDELPAHSSGQFIKFYQRLGNVGIWGFGDGAFQFNFPDHTKLVIAPGRTRSSSPWIDFYHLSPSAAPICCHCGMPTPYPSSIRSRCTSTSPPRRLGICAVRYQSSGSHWFSCPSVHNLDRSLPAIGP